LRKLNNYINKYGYLTDASSSSNWAGLLIAQIIQKTTQRSAGMFNVKHSVPDYAKIFVLR
jgi:hypothetical protein